MNSETGEEPKLREALQQFIFPFSVKPDSERRLGEVLEKDGFQPFFLDDKKREGSYYGEGRSVNHERMERAYLPYAAHVLFPREHGEDVFNRYSKAIGADCLLDTPEGDLPFSVLSVDVLICPFRLGFLTVRVDLGEYRVTFSEAMEFADRFRTLEDIKPRDDHTHVRTDKELFRQVEDYLFTSLVPGVRPFLDQNDPGGAYFETLPFFVDERMIVMGYYGFPEQGELDERTRYRASQLDGLKPGGTPYTSASNPMYIRQYCAEHGYARWAPDTYYMTNEQTFCCLSRETGDIQETIIGEMYGQYYYGLLMTLFHKIVLLKLSTIHSRLRIEHDYDEVENLIYSINKFSAKFYFLELISQNQGSELFLQLRKAFGVEALYREVKQTLGDLFQYQDKYQSKRHENLLMVLTVFTVVSGIYGMNQVIEDLKGTIGWGKMADYSVFEYLALFLTGTGILVSFLLTLRALFTSWRSRRKRRER